ncbi:SURF1 family protein [Rhizobium deserti]|uniref:SURF1-like protein n=1 Tax=Rhizobium deserti TaxID=2547961 RepID=A0A4R5UB32_9HYPH|nr:SURF1 family protein [Rhizobium deserti]TDK32264.1 SURF1 family protein [Rhizobium deserti]
MRPDLHLSPSSEDAAAAQQPSGRGRRASLLLRGFLLFSVIVFTLLGIWQVQRLFWKLDLIARVEARVTAAPVPPPPRSEWPMVDAERFEYQHVHVAGVFDHSREALVQAVTERGPGFWVMTPLRLQEGQSILINRGFVPSGNKDTGSRKAGELVGTVNVTGLLRISEPGGGFLRSNDPGADRWYSRDVAAIAAAKGVSDYAPFFIDADAAANPGGLPVGGLTVVKFHNSHLVYAITWFSLAAMALGATVFVGRYRG